MSDQASYWDVLLGIDVSGRTFTMEEDRAEKTGVMGRIARIDGQIVFLDDNNEEIASCSETWGRLHIAANESIRVSITYIGCLTINAA